MSYVFHQLNALIPNSLPKTARVRSIPNAHRNSVDVEMLRELVLLSGGTSCIPFSNLGTLYQRDKVYFDLN